MDNAALAERLEAFAALLDLAGSSHYTVRAYRRAAELIRSTPAESPSSCAPDARASSPGSARASRRGCASSSRRARSPSCASSSAQALPELVGVARLLGLSPKRMREIGHALGIATLGELREAARAGRLESVPGIGPKTAARIAAGARRSRDRAAAPRAAPEPGRALVGEIAAALGGEPAGDPRRGCDLSTRFAVVVPSNSLLLGARGAAADRRGARARTSGASSASRSRAIRSRSSSRRPERFGTELVPRDGLGGVRGGARAAAGRADRGGGLRARSAVPFRPPELREAARADRRPTCSSSSDIRGDLHAHTTGRTARRRCSRWALAARELGYEYLAICDHTRAVRVVPGLDADDVRRQAEEIAAANELLAPFRVLRGIECDILPDGSLDLPDDVLAELDWVQISLHAGPALGRARR